MMNNKIKIVMGASSSGKSTYIDDVLIPRESAKPIMASNLKVDDFKKSGNIIHYNTFRPFENSINNLDAEFLADDKLQIILDNSDKIQVDFVVVDRSTLLKRTILREKVEPRFRLTLRKNYPSNEIFDLIINLDYEAFHKEWFDLLKLKGIDLKYVSGFEENCGLDLSESEALEIISSNRRVDYSKDEIKHVLKSNRFEYQSVELPFGLSTKGQKREQSLSHIFPEKLDEKSVLDIGCAYGFFCFEAEKRGSTDVCGTELKPERFRGANMIKEVKKSHVNFLRTDIFEEPVGRKFDIVLLLNVIHHLKYPMYALKTISDLCNDILILEYPTVGDPKFQKTTNSDVGSMEAPLIGVSKLSTADQTFLFNDEAIRRILTEHDSLFDRVEIKESPFEKNRRIAYCYK